MHVILWRFQVRPGRTIDRWLSLAAHRAFRDVQSARYAQLDRRCAGLTTEETLVAEVEA